MNGYSSHTYMWINAKGEKVWVKSYWYPVDPDLGARVAKGLGLEIRPESTVVGKGQRK